jgi:hypothetical protein
MVQIHFGLIPSPFQILEEDLYLLVSSTCDLPNCGSGRFYYSQ